MNRDTLLSLSLFVFSSMAWSHGNNADHAKAPLVREQKAWGIAGEAAQVSRTITIKMTDAMRFTPEQIDVRAGETVRLRVHNTGKLQHELVLGTRAELETHAAQMLRFPNMEHEEPYMVHVAPGKTGEIIWTFNRAGEFEFACLIAGHFQAGMAGRVRVVPATADGASHSGHPMAHGTQPYAGQQTRAIKSLSEQDMRAYQQGTGHGFAKAAELNGYPGPLHVLEMAETLQLSATQRARSQSLLERHRAQAQQLGTELIEAERALDQAFAERRIDSAALEQLTLAAGEKQARLRAEHLQTHLAQTALLTPAQIARYNTLRGYGTAHDEPASHNHHQEMHHGQ